MLINSFNNLWRKNNKLKILKILLFIEVFIVLSSAYSVSQDHQDSSILEGLEYPFFGFLLTLIIYLNMEYDIKWVLFFSLIGRALWGIIPALKYTFYIGRAIDQHSLYRFTQDIFSYSYVPIDKTYSATPFFSIFMSINSLFSGISIVNVFKIMPVLYWFMYPLMIYMFINTFKLTNENDIIKYTIILSSIPLKSTMSDIVAGRTFGTVLFIMLIYYIMRNERYGSSKNLFLLVMVYISLIGHHMISALYMVTILMLLYLFYKIPFGFIRKTLKMESINMRMILLFSIITLSWLFVYAKNISQQIVMMGLIYGDQLFFDRTIDRGFVPSRAFQISIIDLSKILLLFQSTNMVILGITGLSILAVIIKYKYYNKNAHFLNTFVITLYMLIVFGFLINMGESWLDRILIYVASFFPLFSISLFRLISQKRKIFYNILLGSLIIFSITSFYDYQSLVPSSDVLSPELSSDDYLYYIGNVNSVYQRYMIFHAQKYLPDSARIASDMLTRNQITSLTGYNYSDIHLAWYYPFNKIIDSNLTDIYYTYFLLHHHGAAGIFLEKAEVRTKIIIVEALYNSSIIYYNGNSFILNEPFMYTFYDNS